MKKLICLLLIVIILPTGLEAKVPDLKFRRLDTRDGMSNSQIVSLFRDSKGFVWIGTPYGLNRYDGYRFRTYFSDNKDTMTLRNNYIDGIQEDYEGRLWLRQGMNYSVFDPVTERTDRHPEHFFEEFDLKGGVEHVYIDNEKNFWLKTYDDGFWCVNPKTKKVFKYKYGYGSQEFNNDIGISHFAETDKYLYLSSNNGEILCFDKKANRILWKNSHLRQQQYTHDQACMLSIDKNDHLWIISSSGTFMLNLRTKQWHIGIQQALRAIGFTDVPDEMDVWDIKCDKDGLYWFATDHGGLWVADPKDHEMRQFLTHKFDESTISDNTLRMIYRDQLGRMWIGTYTNGVNLYTGSLSNFVNLELGNINTVCADKQGYWWLGTNDKGIIRYNPKTQEQQVYDKENSGIKSNTMVGSMVAKDGTIWFGCYEGGIIRIKNGQVTNMTATGDTTGLVNNNIWTLCQDQWDHVWIGTLGGGIQRIDKRTGRMRTLRMENTVLPSDYINEIKRMANGWLLVGHSRFLSLVNPKTMKVVNRDITNNPDGVAITEASLTILEDSRQLIWQGTSSGATVWDPKSGHVYLLDIKKGLFGSTVNGLVEDKKHTVWITTDHGISNVIPQKMQDGSWNFVVRSYNNRDGLQNGPYNQRSMCYTPDGLVLVGGQGGLDVINPRNMGKGRIKETPVFSGLLIFDQDVPVGQEFDGRVILDEALNVSKHITLRYNDQFTIQLGSTSGEIHNKSRFVYQLEGFNENWVRTSELNPNITYNSLSAGDYTLHVRMLNDDGTFGQEESTLEITIRPPLWRSRWMLLLYLIVIGAGAYWWHKWFIKHHEQKMKAETLRRETEKQQWMSEMRRQLLREQQEQQAKMREELTTQAEDAPVNKDTDEAVIIDEMPALTLNLTTVDISEAVSTACKNFAISPEGLKAKINCKVLANNLQGSVDQQELTKAIDILLGNSVRFSPGNCQINVNVGRGGGNRAIIQIADNGIGIRDEFKEHAFDPMLGSEGIGLDRVKQVITAHGGDIRIEDNPGGGTIFVISLPTEQEVVVEETIA